VLACSWPGCSLLLLLLLPGLLLFSGSSWFFVPCWLALCVSVCVFLWLIRLCIIVPLLFS
jgi:hypothetical protein